MILTVTLGFDEKFAVRAVIRHSNSQLDRVVVITPAHRVDERSESAIGSLREILRRYLLIEGVERVEVNVDDFFGTVGELVEMFDSWAGNTAVLNLSGGMRLLVIECLIGALMSKTRMTIELESEDSSAYISFRNDYFDPVIFNETDHLDRLVLKHLTNVYSISVLSELLDLPKTSAWRRIRKLERLGLIEVEKAGRSLAVRLTDKGRALKSIMRDSDR
ncbi:MAG: CRISPR-associated CARF protein Csa3 [Candidatus Caldarchaeales archaeon]